MPRSSRNPPSRSVGARSIVKAPPPAHDPNTRRRRRRAPSGLGGRLRRRPPSKTAAAFTDRLLGAALLVQSALFCILASGAAALWPSAQAQAQGQGGLAATLAGWFEGWLNATDPGDEVTRILLPAAAAIIGVVGFAIAWIRPGRFRTHLAVALAQMTISVLWVYVSDQIGAHPAGRAHAMISLALLTAYADLRVLVFASCIAIGWAVGASVVWADLLEGRLVPVWPRLEHAAYLIAMSGALVLALHRARRSSRRRFRAEPVDHLLTRLNRAQSRRDRDGREGSRRKSRPQSAAHSPAHNLFQSPIARRRAADLPPIELAQPDEKPAAQPDKEPAAIQPAATAPVPATPQPPATRVPDPDEIPDADLLDVEPERPRRQKPQWKPDQPTRASPSANRGDDPTPRRRTQP